MADGFPSAVFCVILEKPSKSSIRDDLSSKNPMIKVNTGREEC